MLHFIIISTCPVPSTFQSPPTAYVYAPFLKLLTFAATASILGRILWAILPTEPGPPFIFFLLLLVLFVLRARQTVREIVLPISWYPIPVSHFLLLLMSPAIFLQLLLRRRRRRRRRPFFFAVLRRKTPLGVPAICRALSLPCPLFRTPTHCLALSVIFSS